MRARSGAVTSQGDFVQHSDALRSANSLSGAGVTVGVLSDSFDCYAVYAESGSGVPVSGGSFTEAKEHVIVLGSLSKTYAMTGWRAGFALGPKPIIAAMSKLQSQSTSSAAASRLGHGCRLLGVNRRPLLLEGGGGLGAPADRWPGRHGEERDSWRG